MTLLVLDMRRTRGSNIRTKIGCSLWGIMWRCSKQAWNIVTLYERDEQQARRVDTCTKDEGLQNHAPTSLFFKTRLHVHVGPGDGNDSLEWQGW
jgi:hypothetical protein